MTDPPRMLTVRQVAEQIGRSPRYVREVLIHGGKVRAIRLTEHGGWLVYADSLVSLFGIVSRQNEPSDAECERRAARARAELGYLPRSKRAGRGPGRRSG